MTVERLSAALSQVASDRHMRQRANEIGPQIRAENGVGCGVAIFERFLNTTNRIAYYLPPHARLDRVDREIRDHGSDLVQDGRRLEDLDRADHLRVLSSHRGDGADDGM